MAGMGGFGSVRAWALAGASVAAVATPAWSQEAARSFNIPAQDMATALEAFGRQSDTDILFSRPEVRGLASTAVSGSLRPEDALRRLVGATRLTVRRVNGSTFVVERAVDRAAMDGPATQLEEIVVTGTHIRNANPTAPVQVVSREDIDRSGYGQVGEVIRSLPANFSGGQNPGVIAAGSGIGTNMNTSNASTINLRGLGTDATLVLLNGRRLGGDTYLRGADISGIPLGAIDRIEIVTDGSSAVYGSDAVAGVANFILRTDYDGVELAARIGGATQGGGFEQTYSVLGGVTNTDWYAMANLEWSRQEAITADQRSFTSGASPRTQLIRPQERTSAYIGAGKTLNSWLSASFDVLFSDRTSGGFDQSSPGAFEIVLANEASSYSVGGELEFRLPRDWALRLTSATFSSENDNRGYLPAIPDYEDIARFWNDHWYVEAIAEGSLVSLPGGDLSIAVGAGRREEDYRTESVVGILSPSRFVDYIFAEARLPLVGAANARPGIRELEFGISGRFEESTDYGSATTPKVGLRYAPVEGLAFRASWGESFKSPTFQELYQARNVILYPGSVFGQAGGGTVFFATGGNPELAPERSTSWTIGADYTPAFMRSARISATYYSIDYTDRVVTPVRPATRGLVDPIFAPYVTLSPTVSQQNDALAGATFTNATSGPYNPANVIAIVNNRLTNATAQEVNGVDISYRQYFEFDRFAVDVFADATWTNLSQQTLPTTPNIAISGTFANVPDSRSRVGATYLRGGFSGTAILNHVSDGVDTGVVPNRRIGSWTTADLTLAYDFEGGGALNGLRLSVSATNLFDRDPPFVTTPGFAYTGINFDSTNASAVGRFISVSARKRF